MTNEINYIHMKGFIKYILSITLPLVFLILTGCSDLIDVDSPVDTLDSSNIFESSSTAEAAVNGIYSVFYNGSQSGESFFSSDYIKYAGEYADEIIPLTASTNYFYQNSLLATNEDLSSFWSQTYNLIYLSNSIIEGCENSSALSDSDKEQFLGEAKFLRAFLHFNLYNYFGEVPLIKTTEVQTTNTQAASTKEAIYKQIIEDLIYARDHLAEDYSWSAGDRTRVNSYAASALLARVYLYNEEWNLAEDQATRVINKAELYSLINLNDIFLSNSEEAIWQVYTNVYGAPDFAIDMIPTGEDVPAYELNSYLLNAFENGDQRKENWIGSIEVSEQTYTYPYKYKSNSNENIEQETILRLGELYLIRAESRAEQNDIIGAQEDLDEIRIRAGLDKTTADDQSSLLEAILKERQVELFCEWGHRFLDLKRTDHADSILGAEKANWDATDILFPIPQDALNRNTNLSQNEGYN